LHFGGRSFARLALEDRTQRVGDVEGWCGWSFGIHADSLLVLHVEVGAVASSGDGDVERFAGS
jgi:hypothetical protein